MQGPRRKSPVNEAALLLSLLIKRSIRTLAFVKAQRPAVRPNYGFLEKLRAKAWLDTSPWSEY